MTTRTPKSAFFIFPAIMLLVLLVSVGCNNSADTEKKTGDTAKTMSADTAKKGMDTAATRPVKEAN